MKALCIDAYGPLSNLKLIEVPRPTPWENHVRVDVACSALNPADNKVARGEVKFLHGRSFPLCLGYDFSGVVGAVGPQATRFKVGDEVFGFLPYGPTNHQGSLSESIVVPESTIALKPSGLDHTVAAASATVGLTALQALRDVGKLKPAARVLITGVSGGVGSLAVGIARRLGASEVIAVGSGRGLDLARRMGASQVIDRKRQSLVDTSLGKLGIVFDAAAATRWADWRPLLGDGAAFVTTLPSAAFVIDKFRSLTTKTSVGFVNVKSRSTDLSVLADWIVSSGLEVPIDATVGLDDVKESLERLRSGNVLGKIVVKIN